MKFPLGSTKHWLAAAVTLSIGSVSSLADDAGSSSKSEMIPAPEAPSPWEFSAASGFSATSGNSETVNLAVQGLASYIEGDNELYLGADYFFGEDDDDTTVDSLRVFGNYNRLVSDRLYLGMDQEYFRDNIADIDYRVTLVPKVGYYVVKTDAFKLGFEIGAGYTWEEQGGIADDYAILYAGERMDLQLTSATSLFQTLGVIAEAGDLDNYRIQADIGLTTRLSDHWALNLFARDTYDATPAAGAEENDLAVFTTLSYAFGGFPEAEAATGRRSLWVDAAPADAPTMGWDSSMAIGASLTQGNSETLAVTAAFDTAFRSTSDEFFFGLGGAYGETESTTTIQNVYSSAQYNRLLNDVLYVGSVTNFRHDDVALVDYRITPAAVVGAYLVKNDALSLAIEAGPGYTFEKVGGIKDDYFTVLAAERFTWAISDKVSFNQSVSGTLDPNNTNNYIITADASLDVALASSLALRTGVAVVYDNEPAAGADDTDTLVSTSLVFKF